LLVLSVGLYNNRYAVFLYYIEIIAARSVLAGFLHIRSLLMTLFLIKNADFTKSVINVKTWCFIIKKRLSL